MLKLTLIIIISSLLVLFLLIIGNILNKKNNLSFNNVTPFECGISSVFYSTSPLSLRFFILAVIFLIFDVELILLFPILLDNIQFFSLIKVSYFLLILVLISWGLLWEWNQTLLNWSN